MTTNLNNKIYKIHKLHSLKLNANSNGNNENSEKVKISFKSVCYPIKDKRAKDVNEQ